ncbi:MAG: hypothetical protein WC008_01370 [Bacilli bacterium]
MKFLLTIFLFTFLSTPALIGQDVFETEVHDIYSEYVVVHEVENSYYRLKIIEGVNNDQVNYGVYLFNLDSKSHSIVISYNDKKYTLSNDNRGDYSVPAFKINDDVTLSIEDNNGNSRYSILLVKRTPEDFGQKYSAEIILGSGEGAKSIGLAVIRDTNLLTILMGVFGVGILFFGFVILLLFIFKKGMFNPKHKNADVFSYKKFLDEYGYNNQEVSEEPVSVDSISEVEPKTTEIINMYPYQRDYEDDEDVDVKGVLRDKGFITDYQILPEEEKNLIMLELMRMRDTGEISKLSYQKEVIDLWKK